MQGYTGSASCGSPVVDTSDSYQTCGSIEGVVVGFQRLTAINQCQQDLLKLLQHTIELMCMKSRSYGIEPTIVVVMASLAVQVD